MKMSDLRAKARAIFGSAVAEPMPNQPNGAKALQQRANARPIPTYKVGGVVKKADGGAMKPKPSVKISAAERKMGDALMMMPKGKAVMAAQAKRDAEKERMGMAKRELADRLLGIPKKKDGGVMADRIAARMAAGNYKKGGKVQTSADTARKLATEMGGMKKGGKSKAKDGLAVMIAIGSPKKPAKKAMGGALSPQDRALLRIRDRQQASAPAPRERDMSPKARAMVEAAADKGARGAPRTAIGRPIPMPNVAKVQYKDGGMPVKKAVGGAGKTRKGMAPIKKAAGGAAKVRKGMMSPTGDIKKVVTPKKGIGGM